MKTKYNFAVLLILFSLSCSLKIDQTDEHLLQAGYFLGLFGYDNYQPKLDEILKNNTCGIKDIESIDANKSAGIYMEVSSPIIYGLFSDKDIAMYLYGCQPKQLIYDLNNGATQYSYVFTYNQEGLPLTIRNSLNSALITTRQYDPVNQKQLIQISNNCKIIDLTYDTYGRVVTERREDKNCFGNGPYEEIYKYSYTGNSFYPSDVKLSVGAVGSTSSFTYYSSIKYSTQFINGRIQSETLSCTERSIDDAGNPVTSSNSFCSFRFGTGQQLQYLHNYDFDLKYRRYHCNGAYSCSFGEDLYQFYVYINFGGQDVVYSYNKHGQVTKKDYNLLDANLADISIAYDSSGRVSRLTRNTGANTYAYILVY